jgi:hypothetical protein
VFGPGKTFNSILKASISPKLEGSDSTNAKSRLPSIGSVGDVGQRSPSVNEAQLPVAFGGRQRSEQIAVQVRIAREGSKQSSQTNTSATWVSVKPGHRHQASPRTIAFKAASHIHSSRQLNEDTGMRFDMRGKRADGSLRVKVLVNSNQVRFDFIF